jgi:alpha-L-arabinofuranosidase
MRSNFFSTAIVVLACAQLLPAETAVIRIDAAKPGPELNPRMYGIFLEEINTGVDGGLYAELIRNRGFEDAKSPEGFSLINGRWNNGRGYIIPYHFDVDKSLPYWSLVKDAGADGVMSLDLENPLNAATPRSCRLEIKKISSGRIGIANEGYWGISAHDGEQFVLNFWARCSDDFKGSVTARLENANGDIVTSDAGVSGIGKDWKKFTATFTATRTEPEARFILLAGSTGTIWFDMVSLFPKNTFKNHPNGLRPDIAQLIADLKPGFVRFPGGCVVEGATPENAYDWKKSIGPIEQRPEIWNVWDYRRTHGMGFFEYLQFCEDIGAEPLYVGFAGQTCIYRQSTNVPMSQMQPIASDFLDAIEFANGPADSTWGKLRAQAGRAKPFDLKMVEIGNENVGREYAERYRLINSQLKSKYPEVTSLANFPVRDATVQMVDEHYYNSPRWFMDNFHMYDRRDRNAPPVYIAEVAVTSAEGGRDKGNLISALAEGVFLMGAERNADVVRMVSYAPLLANVHGRTELAGAPPPWHGMIYFDSSRAFGTASYYLWKTFAENRPGRTLQTDVEISENKNFAIAGQIGVGTWDTSAEFKDVRVEKNGETIYTSDFATNSDGWQNSRRDGGAWSLNDGAFRQSQAGRASSYFGDENWSDYTLTLKARKLGGGEGFLIMFGRNGRDLYWWNLGGWGNSRHAIEHSVNGVQSPVGPQVEGSIETGRWYDIKIALKKNRIQCFLDGRLIHDETAQPAAKFFAVAGRDEKRGDIVLKAINTSADSCDATLNFDGLGKFSSDAQLTLLTSAHLSDNNSLENPTNVFPKTMMTKFSGAEWHYEFPANSLTVLRFNAK